MVEVIKGSSSNPMNTLPSSSIWRDSSYDFSESMNEKTNTSDKGASTEFDFQKIDSFDVELDIENQCLPRVNESSNENEKLTPRARLSNRVSFKENESSKRLEDDQVLRCTSNASCQQPVKTYQRMQTKSRLIDPPQAEVRRSGQLENRSGMLRNSRELVDEDDPFDEDLPDEYKTVKLSFCTLVQWLSLILIVGTLVCSLVIKKLREKVVWGMQLWKWEVMVLVLICGGLVSGGLIQVVVFFIERNFLLRKRVLYFVYGLKSSVQKFLWLCLVFLAWILILDRRVEKETNSQVLPYVTKILICFMVATLVWLVKTLLLKVLAMNFHVSTFFDRIQDALFNQYVIEMLSGPPHIERQKILRDVDELENAGAHIPAEIRATCLPDEEKIRRSSGFLKSPRFGRLPSDKKDGERENVCISIDHLHRMNQKNISAWNMKRLMTVVRKGVLSTLDKHLDLRTEDDHAVLIRTEKESKCAAKRIFGNVARSPSSRHIYLEDLMRFLRPKEADRMMHLFEGATDGKGVSKRALKNWVVNVFRERRALALSLNDTKTAINQLHHLVNILVGITVIIIWLLILGVATIRFLVILSSQAVVLVFVFGNTCKTIFEAIIFLFVMHPFDVGDRCEIDGVQMIVDEMNLLTTVFLRFDNLKITYPNSILATKPINNYYRSPDMGDAIDFCVHISTPSEKIALMKERVLRYIESKKEHWCAGARVVTRDVIDMNRMKLSVWITHTMNHQDMGERWARRELLLEQMVDIFRDLDIEFRELPMEVNVRNMPALASDRVPSNWSSCSKR